MLQVRIYADMFYNRWTILVLYYILSNCQYGYAFDYGFIVKGYNILKGTLKHLRVGEKYVSYICSICYSIILWLYWSLIIIVQNHTFYRQYVC